MDIKEECQMTSSKKQCSYERSVSLAKNIVASKEVCLLCLPRGCSRVVMTEALGGRAWGIEANLVRKE